MHSLYVYMYDTHTHTHTHNYRMSQGSTHRGIIIGTCTCIYMYAQSICVHVRRLHVRTFKYTNSTIFFHLIFHLILLFLLPPPPPFSFSFHSSTSSYFSSVCMFPQLHAVVGVLLDDTDPMVSVMKLEKAPQESYADIGGLHQQIQEIKV